MGSFLNKIKPNRPVASLEGYFISLLGESKFGKTTFAVDLVREHYKGDMSKGLLLGMEIGYKTMADVHAIPIACFDTVETDYDDDGNEIEKEEKGFIEVVNELIENKKDIPYRFIIIDTITALERYAKPYVANKASLQDNKHYSKFKDIPFGNGYDMIAEEIYEQIDRLKKANFGVCIIGHQKVKKIKNRDGFEYDKIMFNLENKTADIIEREADMIIYGDLIVEKGEGKQKTSQQRLLRFRSDGNIVCGTRFRSFPDVLEPDVTLFLEEFEKAVLKLYDNDNKALKTAKQEQTKQAEEKAERIAKNESITPQSLKDKISQIVTPLENSVKKQLVVFFEENLGHKDFKQCDDVKLLKIALKHVQSL
jgi:hypothetical protein